MLHRAALARLSWVAVPGGVTRMGTDIGELDGVLAGLSDLPVRREWLEKECPRREVWVDSFLMAKTVVDNATFALGAPVVCPGWVARGAADHPALVTHGQAADFADWLAGGSGLPIRLPAEEEWERAARGDGEREYPWGDRFSTDLANTKEAGLGTTAPVDSHPEGASPFGVLGMAGNVEEWTRTVYAPYEGAPARVPTREDWSHDEHITRGGSFAQSRDLARCARRHGVYDPAAAFVGVRLVLAV